MLSPLSDCYKKFTPEWRAVTDVNRALRMEYSLSVFISTCSSIITFLFYEISLGLELQLQNGRTVG